MSKAKQIEYQINSTNCWVCTSHKAGKGIYPTKIVDTIRYPLHRYMYQQVHGPQSLAPTLVLRHTCDNTQCINPAHLVPGTVADNVQDRVDRNRSAKGEANGRTVLTDDQVVSIYQSNEKPTVLARLYGVDRRAIYGIRHGLGWKHVTNGLAKPA